MQNETIITYIQSLYPNEITVQQINDTLFAAYESGKPPRLYRVFLGRLERRVDINDYKYIWEVVG